MIFSREFEMPENHVEIEKDCCKGCGVCVAGCPKRCLHIGADINALGYQHVVFEQRQCTTCGMCYFVCPEPGVIKVIKGD